MHPSAKNSVRTSGLRLALAAMGLLHPLLAAAQQAPPSPAPVVFFDIAGPDRAELEAFYSGLFGWGAAANGSFSAPAASPLPATFRQDPAETLIYIGVLDVTATLAQIVERGGSIEFARLEVPGVVVLGMFKDPAGNRVGLVEMRDGAPRIP